MAYNRFNVNIIIRVILLAATSLLIAICYLNRGIDLVLIILVAALILEVISLIRYLNKTNEILTYFLDAVRNEDSSLVFRENTGSTSFDILHRGLNELNRKLKEARMQVAVQEKFYQAVVENTATPIIAYDSNGSILLANSSVRNLFAITNLHSINQIQRVSEHLKKLLDEITPGERKTANLILNGTPAYLSLKAVQLSMGNRDVMIVAINDISQELDSKETESWQKLIRILNHEIMNSVAPIVSLSSTISGFFRKKVKMIKPTNLSEKNIADTIKGLAVIEKHGKGLINFVDSYRSISKLPRPVLKEARIADIFERVMLLAASLMPVDNEGERDKVPVSTLLDHENMAIIADEELIIRVLFNLVKNALEASEEPESARIVLEAGRGRSGRVYIIVSDNGPGIPAEIQDKVFIPFYTTKAGGQGIGLSLSKQIISMHKGKIVIDSEPGTGTRIKILL